MVVCVGCFKGVRAAPGRSEDGAEVLVAQSLKERFRFIFINVTSGAHMELRLPEVFGRARGIYPGWSLSF